MIILHRLLHLQTLPSFFSSSSAGISQLWHKNQRRQINQWRNILFRFFDFFATTLVLTWLLCSSYLNSLKLLAQDRYSGSKSAPLWTVQGDTPFARFCFTTVLILVVLSQIAKISLGKNIKVENAYLANVDLRLPLEDIYRRSFHVSQLRPVHWEVVQFYMDEHLTSR